MLHPVKLSLSTMTDDERDHRTGGQWLRSVHAYLNFRAGDDWRRGDTRNSAERWYYIDAIRFLNGAGRDLMEFRPVSTILTSKDISDIRLSSLASRPVCDLVDELIQLNPLLHDRKILSHFTRLKLARLVIAARENVAHRAERIASHDELFAGKKPDIPLVDPSVFRKAAVEVNEKQDNLFE
jgi:hypothetical protein